MPSRRGHGEGSISQRKSDGLWTARVDLGIVNGKRKQIYGKTRKEVAEKLKGLLRDQQQGLPIAVERQTLAQFLNRWLTEKVEPSRRPNTIESYRNVIRLHITPEIGHIQIAKLTPQDVERLINRVRAKGLAPRMQQYTRAVLRAALNQALKWGLVARNVVTLTDAPRVERFIMHPLTPVQAQRLLDAARGDKYEALYATALWLGLRRGEVLGLRWEDIDFEGRTLRVEMAQIMTEDGLELAPPKTENSRRTLPLPAALVPILKAHRVRQLEEQLKTGGRWQAHGLVFCTSNGTPISPRNLVRDFKAFLQRAELPDIRFHDLRHSCASLLAAQGVPVRVAMDILGHTNIATTQNIYTHVFDDAKRQAADAMDKLFGGVRDVDETRLGVT